MNDQFSYEWRQMQETLQRVTEEAQILAEKFSRLGEDPEIKTMISQNDLARKNILELQREIYPRKSFIGHFRALFGKMKEFPAGYPYRILALKATKKDFKAKLQELKKLHATEEAARTYYALYKKISDPEVPMPELERIFNQEKKIIEGHISEMEAAIETASQLILTADGMVKVRMKQAREAMDSANEALNKQKEKIGDWIIQDEEHAEWIAENALNYKNVALKILQPPIPPKPATASTTALHPPKVRQRPEPPPKIKEKPKPWSFFLAGQIDALPQERRDFIQAINKAVLEKNLPRFKFGSLYDRLMAICHHMTVGERQKELNKVRGGTYDGWKHFAMGGCVILLDIDEQQRNIKVALETREMFKKIWLQG